MTGQNFKSIWTDLGGVTAKKTPKKQPKMIVYAVTKTFENLKPESYRSHVSQSYLIYEQP